MKEILTALGGVAGIGGIALGVVLFVFRDLVRQLLRTRLPAKSVESSLRWIVGACVLIGIAGIAAWSFAHSLPSHCEGGRNAIYGNNGGVFNCVNVGGDFNVNTKK